MRDALIQQAINRATKDTQELEKVKPIAKPKTLPQIKLARMDERELEKIAPKTGYADLDYLVKGFVPGHVYTVTGETNIGKTSIACNFAVRVAFQKKKVLYIALEPENTVIEYIASVFHDKRFDELGSEDLDFEDFPIDVYGKEDIPSLERLVETVDASDRYDLIIIDHIGYFINSEKNTIQQQSNTIKILAGLAKKNKSAIMLIAHLRKRGKNDKKNYTPSSDDISGSGAFKQDSTEVFIMTRDYITDDPTETRYGNTGRLYVSKTKSGMNGFITLMFSERKANIVSEFEYNKKKTKD